MTFKLYLCWAVDPAHEFLGNADPDRVPNHMYFHVCKQHLTMINRCRRDKGMEELTARADSYPNPIIVRSPEEVSESWDL